MFPGNQSLPLGLGFPPPPPPPPVLPGATTSVARSSSQSSAISHAFQKLGNERAGRCIQGSGGGVSVDLGLRKQSSSSDERGTEEDMRPVTRDCYSTGLGSLRMSRHSHVSSLTSPLGSGNSSHQAEVPPSPIRGFQPYRAGEESTLSTLPAFPLPAFPIVDPRFDSFHGPLDVSNAFSLSNYRYDDSLVLDCYPQFPFPHAGLLPAASGIHPLLSPLLRYPADFITQQYMSSYLSNMSQMTSSTSDGRLLSEELRRLSTGKETDREKGREKDKEQERQQDRKKEKEQDWLRERQEWEKQEAKQKMNGISNNGLVPVQGQHSQGQGQAMSLAAQLGELSAAASLVESQRCSGLREAMYSSALISSQAYVPKPETLEAFKNFLTKAPDDRLKSFIHGSRDLIHKEDNDSAATTNGQKNWFTRMNSTSPGSGAQELQENSSSDPMAKKRIPATFHRPFEAAPVNGFGKELPRTKLQKEKSDKTAAPAALNSYKSLNNILGTHPGDHKLSAMPVVPAKNYTQFAMETGGLHNNKKTKDRSDARSEVKRSDDRSVEQIQRNQFESFLENLNNKGQKFQQKKRQLTELSKTTKTHDAVNCVKKDKAIELLALERMKHVTPRDSSLQPPSKKLCLPPKLVPEHWLRSRLDDRERKLVEARKNGTFISDDASDNENILTSDVTHEKLLLITTGPPLKMMRSKRKLDFLKEFGLMTSLSSKEFKFRQERRRRRLHFQRTVTPTEFETATPSVVATLPPKLTTYEDLNMHNDSKHKEYFLRQIGLRPTLPEYRKKVKLMRHGCSTEKKKNGDASGLTADLMFVNHFVNGRNNLSATSELQKRKDTSHLLACRLPSEYHSVRQSTSPSVTGRSVSLSKSSGSHQARNSKLFVNLPPAYSNLMSGIGENEKTLTVKLKNIESSTNQSGIRIPDAPNGRDLVDDSRGPAQQLVASTKAQSVNWQHCRNSKDALTTRYQHCDGGDKAMPAAAVLITKWTGPRPASAAEETKNRQQHQQTNGQHKESLDWPGLSVLIDAYHRYEEEQRLECRILKEQCSRMQTMNHELQFKRDSLTKRISDFKETKEALEKERNMIQSNVDCLKKCLKLFLRW